MESTHSDKKMYFIQCVERYRCNKWMGKWMDSYSLTYTDILHILYIDDEHRVLLELSIPDEFKFSLNALPLPERKIDASVSIHNRNPN